MKNQEVLRPYIKRLVLVVALSVVAVILFNEGAFLLQKDEYDRAPRTVQLIIPDGTAEKVAEGEEVPSIPAEMVFVIGDVLEVVNLDTVSHNLGPVWVPPGSTGKLVMEQAQDFQYSCSFQPTRYLGLDVRQPTTLSTRITAILIAAPTVAVLGFLYSLLMFPLDKNKKEKKSIGEEARA